MKLLITFFMVIGVSATAVSSEIYKGKVADARGFLFYSKWDSCEIEIFESKENFVKAKISLLRLNDKARFSTSIMLFNKEGVVPLLDKLFWDVGNTSESRVPGTHLDQTTEHLLNFDDNEIDYSLRISQRDGFYTTGSSLNCTASK